MKVRNLILAVAAIAAGASSVVTTSTGGELPRASETGTRSSINVGERPTCTR